MLSETINKGRLTQLKALRDILAETIDKRPGARDLAQLSKQYRDTVKEIEDLEALEDFDDPIASIINDQGLTKVRGLNRRSNYDQTDGAIDKEE